MKTVKYFNLSVLCLYIMFALVELVWFYPRDTVLEGGLKFILLSLGVGIVLIYGFFTDRKQQYWYTAAGVFAASSTVLLSVWEDILAFLSFANNESTDFQKSLLVYASLIFFVWSTVCIIIEFVKLNKQKAKSSAN